MRPRARDLLSGVDRASLALLALAILVAQVWLGTAWPVSHDESWHIYFASHDIGVRWARDILADTHPPLSYALMRPLTWLGTDPIWPRLVSIVPSALQAPVMFMLLRRLGVARPFAWVATIAMAGSYTFTVLGVVIRSYSLAMMFLLCAIERMLAVMTTSAEPPSSRAVGAGLACASLAVWSVYPAGLALAALGSGGLLALAACRRGRASVLRTVRAGRAVLWLAFGASLVACAVFVLAGWGTQPIIHVPWFPGETGALAFVVAGLDEILGSFTPLPVDASSGSLAPLAAIGGVLALAWRTGRRGDDSAALRVAMLSASASLLVILALLGLVRVYPFGGEERHMYVLFPFFVIVLGIALQEIGRVCKARAWRGTVMAVTLALATLTSWRSHLRDPMQETPATPWWGVEADLLFGPETDGYSLYLTTSTFGGIYSNLRERTGWDWRGQTMPDLQEYRVGARTAFRDARWDIEEALDTRLFQQLDRIVDHTGNPRVVVVGPCYAQPDVALTVEELRRQATRAGFGIERIETPARIRVLWLRRDPR